MSNSEQDLRSRAMYAWTCRDEIAQREQLEVDGETLGTLIGKRFDTQVSRKLQSGEEYIGDLRFRLQRQEDANGQPVELLTLVQTCPDCGQDVVSGDLQDVTALGRELDEGLAEHRRSQHEGG